MSTIFKEGLVDKWCQTEPLPGDGMGRECGAELQTHVELTQEGERVARSARIPTDGSMNGEGQSTADIRNIRPFG